MVEDALIFGMRGLNELHTLPDRLTRHYQAALVISMAWAADKIIDTAQQQLVPGHGYDTGRLHDSLTKELVKIGLGAGVFYVLTSDAADYWEYVEFGHVTSAGNWWPGYHFLGQAVDAHRSTIIQAAASAWVVTAGRLSVESKALIAGNLVRI